jgi:ATP synthase F1 delta subunit
VSASGAGPIGGGPDLGDIGDLLRSSAEGLVREVAGKLDLESVKDALSELEHSARHGRLEAEITSAVPLTPAERAKIEARLRARYGADLTIAYRVHPPIIGGLIVRVGDRYIDGSVASRLGQLRERLGGTRSA